MTSETAHVWKPCAAGEISGMVTSLRKARRRRSVLRAAGVASVLIAVCATGWHASAQPAEYDYGGIVCSEVRQLASQYLSGHLAEDITRAIDKHLAQCPNCGPKMETMRHDDSSLNRDDQPPDVLVTVAAN